MRYLMVFTLLLALTGCASSAPAAGPPIVVATYESFGGMGFTATKLVVWSNGRLEYTTNMSEHRITSRATPDEIATLQSILESPEFLALHDRYEPANVCCDRTSYVISSPTKTVHAMHQFDIEWPSSLDVAITHLSLLEARMLKR